jgi:preprotein translocase subunit SecG
MIDVKHFLPNTILIMLYSIILVIISIICLLLTLVVLLQSGDGNGLSGIANAGSGAQMMGTRRTADILSKSTSYLGGGFLILCVVANLTIDRGDGQQSTIQQNAPAAAMQQNDFSNPSQTQSAVPQQQQEQAPASTEEQDGGSE